MNFKDYYAILGVERDAGADAIKVLDRIIERNPLDGEALLLAGDYYARNEQREKAEFRYLAASRLQGFEPDSFLKDRKSTRLNSSHT